jgi:multiple sugar transport system ATP-binding protein
VAEVSFRGVEKVFDGGVRAVDTLDLEVADGELLVLLGPSGCGKTTVLRLLAGLETPTGGEIHVGGRRVDQLPPADRDVAMIFQDYALYPHKTVAQNLQFPLRMRGVRREDREGGCARWPSSSTSTRCSRSGRDSSPGGSSSASRSAARS